MPIRSLLFSLQNILAAAEGRTPLKDLSREHRRVLNCVAERSAHGDVPCIGDITCCTELGAPLTVSRRLRDLEAEGWLEVVPDPQNHRRRRLLLTDRAHWSLDEAAAQVEHDLSTVLHLLVKT